MTEPRRAPLYQLFVMLAIETTLAPKEKLQEIVDHTEDSIAAAERAAGSHPDNNKFARAYAEFCRSVLERT